MTYRNSKYNSIPVTFSTVAIVAAFGALAFAAPRKLHPSNLNVDYLGIVVAILAAFATLLLAMQLYNVFSVKEDAQKVAEAKDVIEKYANQVSNLEEKIKVLEEKASNAVYFHNLGIEEEPDVSSVDKEK